MEEKLTTENLQICNCCKVPKHPNDFSKNSKRCKKCNSICNKASRGKHLESRKKIEASYRANSKEKERLRGQKYYQKNKEKVAIKQKKYLAENADKYKKYFKEYREKTRDEQKMRGKKWYIENKAWIRERERERRKNNKALKLLLCLRSRISNLLRGKNKSKATLELLGCSREKFKEHLQSFFLPGMTWENHGTGTSNWHIGHIIHCSEFDLRILEEQAKCFHYSNMRPEWGIDNLTKNDILSNGKRARDIPNILKSKKGLEVLIDELNWIS